MPSPRNSADSPDDVGERRSIVKRLSGLLPRAIAVARRNPLLTLVLVCGTAIIAGSGCSVIYYLITHRPSSDRHVTIQAALALLDAGEYEQAKQLAQRLRRKVEGDYKRVGHPLFVQGAVLAQEAGRVQHEQERQTLYLVAARYLEESLERSFPPGREIDGLHLLATSLFNADRFAESLPRLHEAFEKLPDKKYELSRLLSTAYLRDTQPNLKQAQHYGRLWIEDPALTPSERDEALLQLAEILLLSREQTECHKILSQIGDGSRVHDQALVILARLLIQEGDLLIANSDEAATGIGEADGKYRQAITILERAQSKDLVGTSTRQSRYLLGICHQKLGDLRAATKAFDHARRTHYRTSEALAATLAEAEIAQQQGHHDIALSMYLKVLEEAGFPATYENPWISLSDLQGRLGAGQRQFRVVQEFDSALAMADAFSPILPDDKTAAARAETQESWAEHLLQGATEMGHADAQLSRIEARRRFRLAGDQYRELARLRFATAEYPTDLWKSGHCFLRGQNFNLAIRMLREHLNNVPRKQMPSGLVDLGECHLALGHYNTAISVLDECIKYFPKHPGSYRARLLISSAYRQTGKLAEAKAPLVDNLHNSALTPRSRYWQESLLAYGTLLFQEAMVHERESGRLTDDLATADPRQSGLKELQEAHDLFQMSINSFEEVIARKLEGESANEARYYLAEAYRHSANLPQRTLEIEPTQTRRNLLRQQMRTYLETAAKIHRQLQNHLAQQQNQTDLSAVERRILRNTYFAYADALFFLENYEQAITAYTAATNHCQHEPEALEALLQIAACYRRLDSTAEARGTLLQAESVLSRIRQDADFTNTTRYDRNEWEQLLGWLSQL